MNPLQDSNKTIAFTFNAEASQPPSASNEGRIGTITRCSLCKKYRTIIDKSYVSSITASKKMMIIEDKAGQPHVLTKNGIYFVYKDGSNKLIIDRVGFHDHKSLVTEEE